MEDTKKANIITQLKDCEKKNFSILDLSQNGLRVFPVESFKSSACTGTVLFCNDLIAVFNNANYLFLLILISLQLIFII